MDLKIRPTQRRFRYAMFTDLYGKECSIQESSLAEVQALWLGSEKGRAHIDQEMAMALIPLLQHFVKHGELPEE